MRMTPEEIKRRFPNNEDLKYGFDGTDRDGRTWYGKGIRLEIGPTPPTGVILRGRVIPLRGYDPTGHNHQYTFISTGGCKTTLYPFVTGNLSPCRGEFGHNEIINYFTLKASGMFGISGDHSPLHSYD